MYTIVFQKSRYVPRLVLHAPDGTDLLLWLYDVAAHYAKTLYYLAVWDGQKTLVLYKRFGSDPPTGGG